MLVAAEEVAAPDVMSRLKPEDSAICSIHKCWIGVVNSEEIVNCI